MPRDQDANDRTMVERIDPLLGSVLDRRYRIDFRLAAGGFGAIYRATHIKSGHEVALKVLHPQLTTDAGVVARFRREGATMTTLRSPHTITAYELGEADDGTLYIVMELLRGESLFERFRAHGRFDWKRMVKITRAICGSLGEAHGLGVIHRDLKPTNIHLESKGEDPDFVKVLDFGIAKILHDSDFDSSDLTNAGQMIGTLDYMSPEQMVGGACTGQSDIYTLGILTYEMIAGVRPFAEAQTAGAALAAILKTTPPPLSQRVPVPDELDRILARCLERDPLKRYRDVGELADELDQLIAAHDVDEVTHTVSFDERAPSTTPMDAAPESTMFSMPPPIVAPRATPASTPPPVRSAATVPKFPATLPPPEAKAPPRFPQSSPTTDAARGKPSTAPPADGRTKPPTGAQPLRARPSSTPPPVPISGELTWQGDAPRPASGRTKSPTGAQRIETSDPFSLQPTTPQPVIPRSASGGAPEPGRKKAPTAPAPLPPDSDYATTPVPKFHRPPPTPPTGLPAASPFKTTLPGAQMPPNPNAHPSAPQFSPATPFPLHPPTPTPSPVGGFGPTPFPHGGSPYAPQPVDDGRGSRPVLDLNAFPQQPRIAPTPSPGSYPPSPPGGTFDMGQIQARDAAMRRMVWIAVLVIGALLGIVVASQL